MTSKSEAAKNALGQLFITGFNGLDLDDATAAFLSQAKIGGVLLFTPNYETPAQVAELINRVQECRSGLPLWVSVDCEGGRVQRFKKPFTKIPSAAALTATGSPKLIYEVTDVMAKELKAVGVNIDFAPVVDVLTNPKNPVIGDRAFGRDEDTVTKMASAVVRGLLTNGVQACVKHFPGHGDTSLDSHFALPKVDTPLETLRERELRPFSRAFRSHCSMVMTAHILCTALDPDVPATMSKKILRELLRSEMRYTGLIISDDLEMKAITDHFGADEAPVRALDAGCDLLIYRTEAGCRRAYEAVSRALEAGQLAPEIVLEAAERSNQLKKETLMPYHPVSVPDVTALIGTAEHQAIVAKVTSTA